MHGWLIFTHSVRQVFGNIGPALRISGVLMAVQFLVSEWVGSQMPALSGAGDDAPSPAAATNALILLAVLLITGPWVAVAWHRYVLLSEEPGGVLPRWNAARWGAYLWAMVRVGLALIAAALVLSVPLGGILLLVGGPDTGLSAVVMLIFFAVIYLGNRLSLPMPAAALGEKMTLIESFRKTQPGAAPIAWLSLIYAGTFLVAQTVVVLFAALAPPLGFAAQIALSWLLFLVGASLMTTLYGHYVQGRPLVTE